MEEKAPYITKYTDIMTKTKLLLLVALFACLLLSIRTLWIHEQANPVQPVAVQGVLDLRSWNFASNRVLLLNGEWEFYPSVWLEPNAARSGAKPQERRYIQVPKNWQGTVSQQRSAYGYGSYRLRILVPPHQGQMFGLYVPRIATSYELFVGGRAVAKSGEPSPDPTQYTPRDAPVMTVFAADGGELELVIHVANYTRYSDGGILKAIKFGSPAAVQKASQFTKAMQLLVSAILLLHAVYALVVFAVWSRSKPILLFFATIVCALGMTLLDNDRLLLDLIPLSYGWAVKLELLSYTWVAAFLLYFVVHLFGERTVIRMLRWHGAVIVLYAAFVLISPVKIVINTEIMFVIISVITFTSIVIYTVLVALKRDKDAVFLVLGATAIKVNVAWNAIYNNVRYPNDYYPVDLIIAFLCFALYWIARYHRTAAQTEKFALKLQQADQLKDEFLANTSHELRNPLHGMLALAQAVLDREKAGLDDGNAARLNLLIRVGKRMSLLLNDLLDVTSLKENAVRLQLRVVPLPAVASGVFEMLRYMAEGKPVRFENEVPDDFPAVLADENRLIQILFNLLHNAVKHTNEGSITLHAELQGDSAMLYVADTGIGMDEETQRRAFEPYEQGRESAAVPGGIGLGLSICKSLIELHGGTLHVRSAPGQGSVFSFTLPLAGPDALTEQVASTYPAAIAGYVEAAAALSDRSVEGAATASVSATGTERARILAVDDDPVNLNVLTSMLAAERYEVVTASSGEEALAILDGKEWDLVIADVMMPHMSGYELARTVRERYPASELPILLLTARSRPEDIEAGFQSGASDYVSKPADAAELSARVRALTGLRRSVRERLRMEAAWLQAQIKPHFLYNTLNSVAALSEIDTERMRLLLHEFGHYLHASFDTRNSQQLVPLDHELGLVRSYLFIEQERFGDKLSVTWELDERLDVLVPPLSIQPLVENAVRHGLMKRTSGGQILIRVADCGACVEISIADNGIGMDADKLRHLFDGVMERRTGIGLQNTNKRLKRLYGKGLRVQSVPGEGTTISFSVSK